MPSSEGIRVAVRVRPFLPQEKGSASCVEVDVPSNQISIGRPPPKEDGPGEGKGKGREGGRGREQQGHHQRHRPRRTFTFDHSLAGSAPQRQVYEECVSSLVRSCLDGYNATTLAYGQTGSGKTYTILGPSAAATASQEKEVSKEVGIIPRALGELFGELERSRAEAAEDPSSSSSFEYSVGLQFLELYGEDIRDLLAPAPKKGTRPAGLTIRDTRDDCEVLGATSVPVGSAKDALLCLTTGMLRRVTGATAMNAESSRSHAIMSVLVEQVRREGGNGDGDGGGGTVTTRSKFNFVDLAGSERAKRTGAEGTRLREGIDINKGLLVLGNVISALATIDPANRRQGSAQKFVPFRDSKLTRILRGSLGGNHKTLLFVCVSPSNRNLDESLNALRYANRAKNIKNAATRHVSETGSARLVAELREQVGGLARELLRIHGGGALGAGGAAYSLEALQGLAGGGGGGGGAAPAPAPAPAAAPASPTAPPQDQKDEGDGGLDVGRIREVLSEAQASLAASRGGLEEMTRERDELRRRLEGVSQSQGGEAEPGEGALNAIVERIVSYQREMEDAWDHRMRDIEVASSGSSITFDDLMDDDQTYRTKTPVSNYDLDVASGLYSTGLFLVESQAYADSLPCFQVALEIRREQFGWDDPGVGDVLYMEGLVRACVRDHDKALILLYDALRIRKNNDDARNIAATLRTIGDLHVSKKEYQLADMFYEECLHSAMECNDSALPDIWLSLAKVKKKVGQKMEALDCVEEILVIWREKFVARDQAEKWEISGDGALRRNYSFEEQNLAPTLYDVGVLAFQLNGGNRGYEALNEFIQIREFEGMDISDVKVANACYTLGNYCSAKKDVDEATKFWNRSLEIYHFVGLPDDHPHILSLQELTQKANTRGNRLLSGIQHALKRGDSGQIIDVVSHANI